MANDITIKLRVDDQSSLVIDRFASAGQRKLKDFTARADAETRNLMASMRGMASSIQANWLAITGGAATITAGIMALRNFTQAFLDADKAQNDLASSFALSGNNSRKNIADINAYAEAVMYATGKDDDLVVSHIAMLETFKNTSGIAMTTDQLEKAYAAAADLAVGRNKDLASTVTLVGKAFAGNTDTLGKFGITIAEGIPDAEKFDAVLRAINESVGGKAQANLNSYAGQVEWMTSKWGNFKEMMGYGVVKAIQLSVAELARIPVWFTQITLGIAKIEQAARQVMANIAKDAFLQPDFGKEGLKQSQEYIDYLTTSLADSTATQQKLMGMYDSTEDYGAKYDNVTQAVRETGDETEKTKKKTMDLALELAKLDDVMQKARDVNATAGMDEATRHEYEITQRWIEVTERMQEQAAKIGKSAQDIAAMQAEIDTARQNEILAYQTEQAQKAVDEQVKIAEEGQTEQARLLDKQQNEAQRTYDTMAGFFRDSLTQMGKDTGSFTDLLVSKLKNVAASLAGNSLASIVMSLMGYSDPSGSQGGGGIMSLFGLGGSGGSSMGIGNLFSNGSNLYRGYQWLSGLFGGGSGTVPMSGLGYTPLAYGTDGMATGAAGAGSSLGSYAGAGGYAAAVAFVINALMGYGDADKAGFGDMKAEYGIYSGAKSLGAWKAGRSIQDFTGLGGMGSAAIPMAFLDPGLAMVMGVDGAAIDERLKQQKLARNYYRGIGRAANADISNMSLGQYVAGGSSVLSREGVDAAIEIGGVKDQGVVEEMYRVLEISKAYKQAVEESGGSSAQAIGQFQRVSVELEALKGRAAGATGASRDLLLQFQAIAEKTKTLQLKQLTTDLQSGIGLFSATIDKLRAVGMDEDELNKLVASEGLKFLTTDTLPALSGELSRVREEYKKAADAVDAMAEAEAGLTVKTQILRSDMELTEQQLRAIKEGTVNSEMIELAQALGDVNQQLTLVSASATTDQSAFEGLASAVGELQKGIDGMAAMYKDMDADQIPEMLLKTYGALQQITSTLAILAQAGQKIEALPDTFESLQDALAAGDMVAANAEILNLTTTVMYLSAAMEQMGMTAAASWLAFLGPIGAVIYAAIELWNVFERSAENAMDSIKGNTALADWFEEQLAIIEDRFPKIGAWLRDMWDASGTDDIVGTLRDLASGKMSITEAGGVALKYRDYGLSDYERQQKQILNESGNALATLGQLFIDKRKEYSAGGITDQEQADLDYIWDQIMTVTNGTVQALQDLEDATRQFFEDIQQSIIDFKTSIELSKLNVFSNPEQMSQQYAAQYQEALAAFNAADPQDIGGAWQDLQQNAQAYLDFMFQQYGSSQTYQNIYNQIMAMLDQAGVTVGDAGDEYMSEYETQSAASLNTVATNTTTMADNTTTMAGSITSLVTEIKLLSGTIAEMKKTLDGAPKETARQLALVWPNYKR